MTSNPIKLAWVALLYVCLVALCSAQDNAKQVGLRFRTFGWQVAADGLLCEIGGKEVPLEVLEASRSRFYDYSGPLTIVVYRLVPGPEGKKVRQTVATADISAAGRWPLLVFMPDKEKGPEAIRIVPLADDLSAFPAPQFRFVNFTPVMLGLTLGKERVALAPRALHALDPALKSGEGTTTRYFVVSIASEEGPKMLYANNWVVRPTQRTLVFIFATDNALQVRRIVEDVNQFAPSTP
ncbi:MAG: hypothetical protein H7Y06_00350 [Opitutaceae bacterium]|nr:hypothetical protein [Opitutaceae bacterium]